MKTFYLKTNVNCGACIKKITPYINEIDEVETWSVDTEHPDKIMKVVLEEGGPSTVIEALSQAGYKGEKID